MNRIPLVLLCPLLLFAMACGPRDRQEITETRTVPSPEMDAKDTATQLGMPELAGPVPASPAAPAATLPAGHPPVSEALRYELPDGWQVREPRPMRDINLGIEGAPETECFVSVIPGDGGGLEMNINRWAAQMGLDDLSGDAIDALPRLDMLGVEGRLLELEGHYTGMRGEADIPGALLLGAIAFLDNEAVFVKFTGPKDIVEREREAFIAFCQSIAKPDAPAAGPHAGLDPHATIDPHAGIGGLPPAPPAGDFEPSRLAWSAPDTWERGADRPMREATYTVSDSPETECYITVLGSDGGGLAPNLNRWRAQMGNSAPFTEAELDAMPRIAMLGREAVLISLEGDYTGMTGATLEGYALRGAVVLLGSHSVFVRMTGPAAVIEREHDNFIAFCESMTTES